MTQEELNSLLRVLQQNPPQNVIVVDSLPPEYDEEATEHFLRTVLGDRYEPVEEFDWCKEGF